jgi:hypothetical protein
MLLEEHVDILVLISGIEEELKRLKKELFT